MISIEDLMSGKFIFYAHPEERIEEHTQKVCKYWSYIIQEKHLNSVLNRLKDFWNITDEKEHHDKIDQFIWSVMENTITLHDIGKINPLFQKEKMKNLHFKNIKITSGLGTEHSIISSILYMDYYLRRMEKLKEEGSVKGKQIGRLVFLIYINGYIISKHHGSLGDFSQFAAEFDRDNGKYVDTIEVIRKEIIQYTNQDSYFLRDDIIEKYQRRVSRCYTDNTDNNLVIFIYERLMFSLLLACDYYATSEQISKIETQDIGIIGDIHSFIKTYEETDLMKSIRQYQNHGYRNGKNDGSNINVLNELRSELFLDAEASAENCKDKNMIYFQAPTGMGKTNVAMNLSFKCIENNPEINKIWYIYPFNTLVEQNEEILRKTFEKDNQISRQIHVVNSLHSLIKEKTGEIPDEDYKRLLLDRQFFNYPITLSTHVTLFDIMFGNRRESAFSFHQLANSIIVLDEIQSYKNTLWSEIITFFNAFAKILNCKIIIMSATLPKLNTLTLYAQTPMVLLPNSEKYYNHPLYLKRSRIHYELLSEEQPEEALKAKVYECVKENKKVLIEFITKKAAVHFYNMMSESDLNSSNIELITGDDSIIERKRILDKVKKYDKEEACLLIATQVIEAGVDLNSMEVGFKDISILDSEEQFMGRVNRSCNMKQIGDIYFFNLDEARNIYRGDVRVTKKLTLQNEEMRHILEDKSFEEYYTKVMEQLKLLNNSYDMEINLNNFFAEDVGRLNANRISERMQLINSNAWQVNVFFNRTIEVDGKMLVGRNIWNQYKMLLQDQEMEYSKKQVLLGDIRSKMNYFIYQVKAGIMFQYSDSDTEQVGELYYVEEANEFFINNKFDREGFENHYGLFV